MIQLRRGLDSNLSNIVLEPGQLGWSEDTHTLKVGDGATPYSNLMSLSPLPSYLSSTGIDGTAIHSFSIKLGESSSVFEGKLYLYDDTIESLAYLDSIGPMNLKCSPLYVGLPDDGITSSIKNVSTPIDNTDAANKSYVDSRTNEYVIESGTSGIWTYRKWNSGIAECWGRYSKLCTNFNTWGSLYMSAEGAFMSDGVDYPFSFIEKPIISATLSTSSGLNGWLGTDVNTSMWSTEKTPAFSIIRATALSGGSLPTWHLDLNVVGKWK